MEGEKRLHLPQDMASGPRKRGNVSVAAAEAVKRRLLGVAEEAAV